MEALSPFTMHENSQHDTNGDAKKKISPQKYVPRAHAKSQREFAIPLYDSKAVTFNEQPKQGLQATYSSQKNRSDNAIQQYQGSKMTLDDTVTNESLLHRMNEQLEQSYSKRALT